MGTTTLHLFDNLFSIEMDYRGYIVILCNQPLRKKFSLLLSVGWKMR